MKLRILAAVAAMTVLVSAQAFAVEGTFEPFTYELCDQSPRELAASSSDREFNFVTAMCKRHDSNYGKSDSEKTNFTFDNSDCPITFGRATSVFTSREELRALEKFCDKLKKESGKPGAAAMEATTASMRDSIHSFGSEPSEPADDSKFNFDSTDCMEALGDGFSIFTSREESRARKAFCDEHKVGSGKSANKDRAEKTEGVRDDAWYEKHSRYIRWTVIRNRSEGMPEECRYFFCDMQGGWVTKIEARNFWIITLPRNKGAPEDCKRGYCQKVYTESDTRPAVNEMYRGTGLAR